MRTLVIAVASACLLLTNALADGWDKKTILTVNQPVLVPGATLQPGKYVVKLVDSQSNRHIVRIMNQSEDQVITTVLAIPNWRLKPTGDTQFTFWETPAGNPPAVRAWFYPGDNFGQEFAYPKGLAARIATAATDPVPTFAVEPVAETELGTAQVTTVQKPQEQPAVIAQSTPPVASEVPAKPAPEQVPTRMPETGGFGPLFLTVGLAATLGGFALRQLLRSA
jgi:hypothetical protein